MNDKWHLIEQNHTYLDIQEIKKAEEYPLIPARSGSSTIKVPYQGHDIYLHSKYDPIKESRTLVDNTNMNDSKIVFILGLGLGYHLVDLLNKYSDHFFIVIEEDKAVLKTYFNFVSDDIIKKNNIVYLLDPKSNELSSLINNITSKDSREKIKFRIFKYQPSIQLRIEHYDKIEKMLLEIFSNYYSNILTDTNFEMIWQKNIIKNKKIIKDSKKLKDLKGIYRNKPMIIVCAGPSLEDKLEFIKTNQEEMIIVCVDTAYRYLIKNKILPHHVLSLDANYENLGDFKFIKSNPKTSLIFDIVSFPKIPELFIKRYITYTQSLIQDFYTKENRTAHHKLIDPVIKEYGDFAGLQSGGSVATNALDFALWTEAEPIYYIGLDLSYINYKTHCQGSYKERYLLERTNKFYNYETLNFISVIMRKNIREEKENNIIHYDFILRKYQSWFEKAFALLKDKEIKIK